MQKGHTQDLWHLSPTLLRPCRGAVALKALHLRPGRHRPLPAPRIAARRPRRPRHTTRPPLASFALLPRALRRQALLAGLAGAVLTQSVHL